MGIEVESLLCYLELWGNSQELNRNSQELNRNSQELNGNSWNTPFHSFEILSRRFKGWGVCAPPWQNIQECRGE